MKKRTRALDAIKPLDWHVSNPFFKTHVTKFDRAFIQNDIFKKDHYVLHGQYNNRDSFEHYLSDAIFDTTHGGGSKTYFLKGQVGSGKSTLCKFFCDHFLTDRFGTCLSVYFNFYQQCSEIEDNELNIAILIKDRIVREILNKLSDRFPTKSRLAQEVFRYTTRGDNIDNILSALKFLDENVSLYDLVAFTVTELELSQQRTKKHILLVFDNLDECPKHIYESIISISGKISDNLRELNHKNHFCMLFPVRHYTARVIDTETYPSITIPSLDIYDLCISKLNEASSLIQLSAPITESVGSTKKGSYKQGDRILMHSNITVENSALFIKLIIDKARDDRELNKKNGFVDRLKSLSGNNYKITTRNIYYMFHSCKLPLAKLFHYVFLVRGSNERKEMERSMKDSNFIEESLLLELLMCIHTPFYDLENSNIINLFCSGGKNKTNDYRDTFVSYRILYYLYNNNNVTKQSLLSIFKSLGYDKDIHINPALEKLLGKCLISPDFGTKLKDLNDDTPIEISIVGRYYCDEITRSLTYHDYILSDIFMEEEYIYPITSTYKRGEAGFNVKGRREQRRLYLLFLQQEEAEEEKAVLKKGWLSYEEFLKEFGHMHEEKPQKISDMIQSKGDVHT